MGMACDIGFENRLALENTRLLLTYAMIDTRLRTLVLFRTFTRSFDRIDSAPDGSTDDSDDSESMDEAEKDQQPVSRDVELVRLRFAGHPVPLPHQAASAPPVSFSSASHDMLDSSLTARGPAAICNASRIRTDRQRKRRSLTGTTSPSSTTSKPCRRCSRRPTPRHRASS